MIGPPGDQRERGIAKRPFQPTWIWAASFLARARTVAAPDARAAANVVLFRQLGNRNLLFERQGLPRVTNYSACARFKFSEGRLGAVSFVADITVGTAGRRGLSTVSVLLAGISAVLRKGTLEARRGQLDFSCDVLTLRKNGVDFPPKVNQMGHDVLSVVALADGPSRLEEGPR